MPDSLQEERLDSPQRLTRFFSLQPLRLEARFFLGLSEIVDRSYMKLFGAVAVQTLSEFWRICRLPLAVEVLVFP